MHKNSNKMKLSGQKVFFDFDNTIAPFDVLDDIIERFSTNDKWVAIERNWKRGRIGSLECLKGQLAGIGVSRAELERYLLKVRIDPYFTKLLVLFKQRNIKPVIASDSFSFVIRSILRNSGIRGVRVYANNLRFKQNRIIPAFPLKDKTCLLCAHCKKKTLLKEIKDGRLKIYIGDGLSDLCPSRHADLVFAKDALFRRLKGRGKSCIRIRGLKDVYDYFQEEGWRYKNRKLIKKR